MKVGRCHQGDQAKAPQAKRLAHLGNTGWLDRAGGQWAIRVIWSKNLWLSFLPGGVHTIGTGGDSPRCSHMIDSGAGVDTGRPGTKQGLEHLDIEQVPGSPAAVCGIKHGDSLQAEMLLFKQPPTGTGQASLSQQGTLGGTCPWQGGASNHTASPSYQASGFSLWFIL